MRKRKQTARAKQNGGYQVLIKSRMVSIALVYVISRLENSLQERYSLKAFWRKSQETQGISLSL